MNTVTGDQERMSLMTESLEVSAKHSESLEVPDKDRETGKNFFLIILTSVL